MTTTFVPATALERAVHAGDVHGIAGMLHAMASEQREAEKAALRAW